ncbi:hypothetical protein HYFRA_00004359 [Hymenoscyphus fraxineus]|uniref:G domain-containing protein n=1 Tax=Hymenoscyphus fraxineus TaxID=746836 RepID=A0A9N9KQ19_9HELO|nr:hypothetical protein HYFRA_00004359 [Hymenoscyphus fraxineus]
MFPAKPTQYLEDLTPLDAEGGFVMDFNVEIVEDVAAEIENVMRLGAVGAFEEARNMSKETVEHHLDTFPVLVEYLRLLYDQGDYISLEENVQKALERYNDKAKPGPERYPEQNDILSLMGHIGRVHRFRYSKDSFGGIPAFTNMVSKLLSVPLDKLDEEDVLAIVLMLKLRYLEHQRKDALPTKDFLLWQTENPRDDLCTLLEHLIQTERYWAAENVLTVCFRKTHKEHFTIRCEQIWKSIEWYATSINLADGEGKSIDLANWEEKLWAKTALLQTFCRGLLCSNSPSLRLASGTKPWDRAMELLSELPKLIQKSSHGNTLEEIEETYHGDNLWKSSRSFRRQCLIELDKRILDNNTSREIAVSPDDLRKLWSLSISAEKHQDNSILNEVRWRIQILAHGLNPTKIAMPDMTVPFRIYADRQKLIQQLHVKGGGTIHQNSKIWAEITDDGARPQDPFLLTPEEQLSQHRFDTKRILILGHTGAGKSTLFCTLTGAYSATSHSPVSCTTSIQQADRFWKDGMLRFIDTPGFGDGRDGLSNHQVLELIAEFLKNEYLAGRKLHAIFYLIDASKGKIDESVTRQINVFKLLIGDDVWKNVCFVFTHCVSPYDNGPTVKLNKKKHKEFKEHLMDDILNIAKSSGAQFCDSCLDFSDYQERIKNETRSDNDDDDNNVGEQAQLDISPDQYHPADITQVKRIWEDIISLQSCIVLECQREMVDQARPFSEIQAALRYENITREELDRARMNEARVTEDYQAATRVAEECQAKLDTAERGKREAEESQRVENEARMKAETSQKEAEARAAELEKKAEAQRCEDKKKAEESQRVENEARMKAETSQKEAEARAAELEKKAEAQRREDKKMAESAKRERREIKEEYEQLKEARETAERKIAELELLKKKTEEARKKAELLRKETEEARKAELLRKETDEARKAELLKKKTEEARKKAELLRKEKEEARKKAELLKKKTEEARKKAELLRKETEEAREKAELLRKEKEEARKAIEAIRKEIRIIESSSGWTSRYIVHNQTQVRIHVRMSLGVPPYTVVNFVNNINPGKLKAIHGGPGWYAFEVFLSTQGNEFNRRQQVGEAIQEAAQVAVGAAGITVGVATAGTAGTVGVIVACVGTGAVVCKKLVELFNKTRSTGFQAEYLEKGFRSTVVEGEDHSVIICSKAGQKLHQQAELQMLGMEATRKGNTISLYYSESFGLIRTTRLQIKGGPTSSRKFGNDNTSFTEYVFGEDTEPITISRVDKFDEELE